MKAVFLCLSVLVAASQVDACANTMVFDGLTLGAFIDGNFTAPSSDCEGPLFVDGDFTVNSYSIGKESFSDYHTDILYVSGTVTWRTGMIVGNIKCGSAAISVSMNESLDAIPSTIEEVADLSARAATIRAAVAEFADYTLANKGVPLTIESSKYGKNYEGHQDFPVLVQAKSGVLDFDGDTNEATPGRFEMTCTELRTYHSIHIKNVPADRNVIFFITGNSHCQLSNMNFLGTEDFTKVLFYFTDATKLLISETSVPGSVLAPKAVVTAQSGEINGQVFCKSWTGMTQINYFPYQGC